MSEKSIGAGINPALTWIITGGLCVGSVIPARTVYSFIRKTFPECYRKSNYHPHRRQVTGTGLGLAIVKGVVEAHHGTIDMQSVVDQETTFKILLPIVT